MSWLSEHQFTIISIKTDRYLAVAETKEKAIC